MVMPGEKPSDRVHGAGSVGELRCIGSVCAPNCTWWPVTVLGSSTSQAFEGKGKPQTSGTSGSQPVVASASGVEEQPRADASSAHASPTAARIAIFSMTSATISCGQGYDARAEVMRGRGYPER